MPDPFSRDRIRTPREGTRAPSAENIAREAASQALHAAGDQQRAIQEAVAAAVLAEQMQAFGSRAASMERSLEAIQGTLQQVLLNQQAGDGRMALIEQHGQFTAKHVQAVHTSLGLLDERVASIERGTTEAAARDTRALRQKSISSLKEVAPIIVATGSAIASVVAAIAVIWHSPSSVPAVAPQQPPAAIAPKPTHAGE